MTYLIVGSVLLTLSCVFYGWGAMWMTLRVMEGWLAPRLANEPHTLSLLLYWLCLVAGVILLFMYAWWAALIGVAISWLGRRIATFLWLFWSRKVQVRMRRKGS